MSYRLPHKSSWHFAFPIEISEGVQQQKQQTGRQIKHTNTDTHKKDQCAIFYSQWSSKMARNLWKFCKRQQKLCCCWYFAHCCSIISLLWIIQPESARKKWLRKYASAMVFLLLLLRVLYILFADWWRCCVFGICVSLLLLLPLALLANVKPKYKNMAIDRRKKCAHGFSFVVQ